MHVRHLIELGARIALTGPRLVRESWRLSPTGVHEYWVASGQRLDLWRVALDPYTPQPAPDLLPPTSWANTLRPLLDEIITGELLTRIWTALGIAHVRAHGQADCEPILRNVLFSHLETRNRALNCLVYGSGFASRWIVELQRVRRRVERWTDLLLGEMQRQIDVAEMAHDARRVRDYARTAPTGPRKAGAATDRLAEDGLILALRETFATSLSPVTLHPQVNQAIATSVLGCFHGDWLDSSAWSPDHWLTRLHHSSNDTLLWIDDLLSLDTPHSPTGSGVAADADDAARDE